MSLLLRVRSAQKQTLIPLTQQPTVTVGRHATNIVRANDERMSRYHCVIELKGQRVFVTDLQSRNGTRINDQKIQTAELKPGDTLLAGGLEFAVISPCLPPSTTPSSPPSSTAFAPSASPAFLPPTPSYGQVPPAHAVESDSPLPSASTEEEITLTIPGNPPAASPILPAQQQPVMPAAASIIPSLTYDPPYPPTPPPPTSPTPTPPPIPTAHPSHHAPAAAPMTNQTPVMPMVAADLEAEMSNAPVAERRRAPSFYAANATPMPAPSVTSDLSADQAFVQQENTLLRLLDQLADQTIQEKDVSLLNCRGQKIKMPDRAAAKRDGLEGVVMLRLLLILAARTQASDIHVEPKRDEYQVRIRVDGMMVPAVNLHNTVATKLVNVVKVLCDLDIMQRRIVQDGNFTSHLLNRRVDYRISFAPSMYGQKLVIRTLDLVRTPQSIKDLMMPAWMAKSIRQTVQQDAGMLIVCGPTGSGKTTSLYAAIRDIQLDQRNVITIEDPPEFHVDGITQIAINEQQGNTFATLLRSVLRQDPDVILVGEIRDGETARIAMQAAMTGHMVLSTVHARDSIGTIFRLMDLGVEPYLVASAINLVLGQRLIRRLCPVCRIPVKLTMEHYQRLGQLAEGLQQVYYPGGCPKCLNTGYHGRQGLFELLTATDEVRDVILKSPTIQEFRRATRLSMFASLKESGAKLVAEGITSFDEIDRVLGSD